MRRFLYFRKTAGSCLPSERKVISMKKKSLVLLLLVVTSGSLMGCAEKKTTSAPVVITAAEAKDMMDKNPGITILDVRTASEFQSGHIKSALLIPYDEINSKAESMLRDKSAPILVYCRSGRRSAIAAQALADLGYSKVYDFGGIADWPYETVTE